jgi:hypothetical protein
MADVVLTCLTCGKEFKRSRGEYNRRVRLNKLNFYCSQSCCAKTTKNIERLKLNKPNYPIWKHSNNQRDQYSKFRPIIKCALQRKKKEFDLTLEYLAELWESQNGICPFTGFSLELRTHTECNNIKLNIRTASLDRIDNSKGYVKGNVRFVSVMFNFARNAFSDNEVIEFAKAITQTNEKKNF